MPAQEKDGGLKDLREAMFTRFDKTSIRWPMRGSRRPVVDCRAVRSGWRRLSLTVVLGLISALSGPGVVDQAWAQAEVYLEVRKGELFQVPIAIEAFIWRDLDPVIFRGRQRAEEVLANDLVCTDAFIVLHVGGGEEVSGGLRLDVRGQPVDRPAQARVRGEVRRDGSGLILKGTLLDEGTGKKIFERSYEIDWDPKGLKADRWGLHRLADDITFYLTGTRGCAATRIAFIRGAGEVKEIFMVDWDGLNEQAVTSMETILISPSWHPSGRWIAFTSYDQDQPRLLSLDLSRGRLEEISDWPTPAAVAYSPDGKSVAFSTTRDGNAEIYVARSDGSRPRRLTFHVGIDTAPSWSPSGRRLVFTSDRWGSPQLFTINVDATELQQLTYAGGWNDSPDWSPVSDRLVHACMIDGSFELALIHADGRGWRRLTIGGLCENPRWAPDGRHVVFSRRVSGHRNLWILDVDSGNLRRLTRFKGESYNPAWSCLAKERLCPSSLGG